MTHLSGGLTPIPPTEDIENPAHGPEVAPCLPLGAAEAGQPATTSPPAAARGRFAANLRSNLGVFALNLLVGLWFVPYLIRHLGVAAYGLIPLTMTVTGYLTLITIGLNSAVGRYIMIALEQGDVDRANRVFNTSLMGGLALVVLLIVPGIWLASHADLLFRLPAGYHRQASLLFALTIGMFMVSTISTPFETSSFCRNRFDLRNIVAITALLVRVGLIVLLFNLAAPKIWHFGVAALTATAVSLLGSFLLWRKLTPMLTISPGSFSWASLRELTSTGGWLVITQIGVLLYLGIDLLVVNRMLGADAGGKYAAVMQWSLLLRGMAGTIAVVFGPTIVAHYARNDINGVVTYARRAVRFVGFIMALPIALICGFSRPILHVWLGHGFAPLAPLMTLMTAHLCINLSVMPLFNLQLATNRVRWPGIITCVMGMGNLGLAVLLTGPAHWGMYGVAAAGAIMLTAKNAIFTPLYAAHIIGQRRTTFAREVLVTCSLTAVFAAVCWWLTTVMALSRWSHLILVGLGVCALYGIAVFLLLLSPAERKQAWQMVPGRQGEVQAL